MSNCNNIFDEIKLKASLEDELEKAGARLARSGSGRMKCCCPLHEENTPSFMLYRGDEYDTYYCWGCVEETEPILTQGGFIPIKDVTVGDYVLGFDGIFSKVTEKTSKGIRNVYNVVLGSSKIPLKLTEDHICFFIKQEDVLFGTPYIRKEKYDNRIKFSSRLKSFKRSKKYLNKIKITESTLKEVSCGDYFLYPIVKNRKQVFFDCSNIIKCYTKGTKTKRINKINVNEDVAWLMGMYLAEGSFSDRAMYFSLSYKEKEISKKIQRILKNELGLKSSLRFRKKRNSAEVVCYNVDIINMFNYLFGKYVYNKKIPFEFFYANESIQKSLIEGYLEGDRNYNKTSSVTVSEKLAYSVFSIAIQCGMSPYISERNDYIDKSGILHSKTYWITFRQRESLKGFFEEINGNKFFITKVIEKNFFDKKNTYDLGVDGSSSFTTKNCVVHNCKSGGDVIEFIKALKKYSTHKEVVEYFTKHYNLEYSDKEKDLDELFSDEFERRRRNKVIYNYGISTSRMIQAHLRAQEDPAREFHRIQSYLKALDSAIHLNNMDMLKFHRESVIDYIRSSQK